MITAVDTNVLLDILIGEAVLVKQASSALQAASDQGLLITSVIVCAEISSEFEDFFAVERFLNSLCCTVTPIHPQTAHLAGQYFHAYRLRGGDRTRILPRLPHRRPRASPSRPAPHPRRPLLQRSLRRPHRRPPADLTP